MASGNKSKRPTAMSKHTEQTIGATGIRLCRLAALGFGLWYGAHFDWTGLGVCVVIFWILGIFVPGKPE